MPRAALSSSLAAPVALALLVACGGEPQPVSPAPVSSSLPPPAASSAAPTPSAHPIAPPCSGFTPQQEELLHKMEQSGREDLVEKAQELRSATARYLEQLEASGDPEKVAKAAKMRADSCPR